MEKIKFGTILVIIACVLLSDTLASNYHKVDEAHSHVMSYVQENMVGVPFMMRGNGVHLECFNGFLPLINSLAARARDVSYGCVSVANFEKDLELSKLKNARVLVAAEVQKIQKSLTDCSQKDGLDYFLCLQDNAEANRKLMATIKDKSKDLMSKYSYWSDAIDIKQQTCIMKAVNNAKAESDQAFVDLKSCIKAGPIIQTQIDNEGITAVAASSDEIQ